MINQFLGPKSNLLMWKEKQHLASKLFLKKKKSKYNQKSQRKVRTKFFEFNN